MTKLHWPDAGDQQTAYSTLTCSPVNLAPNVSSSRLLSGNDHFFSTEITRHTLLPSDWTKCPRTHKNGLISALHSHKDGWKLMKTILFDCRWKWSVKKWWSELVLAFSSIMMTLSHSQWPLQTPQDTLRHSLFVVAGRRRAGDHRERGTGVAHLVSWPVWRHSFYMTS